MASNMNVISIPCRGGLNLSSNNQELLGRPFEAIRLVNFECSKEGGYRRILGTQALGITTPDTGRVLGVRNYQGVLMAKNASLYHSFDNTYWTQVNFNSTNVDEATMLAGTELPRTGASRYMFESLLLNTKQYILMVDGVSNPGIFSVEGTSRATASYRYKEITEGAALVGAKYCTLVRNQFIIAGMPANPSAFFYSSHATTDLISPEDADKEIPQENFNGATAGFIGVGDIITGLAMQRDVLYVFCQSSIFKVTGLDTASPTVSPVTRNIGCLDGFSIQEVGGDLLFLAPDGLRTVSKTERIDDLELGVVSRNISKILDPRIRRQSEYEFNSTVIREKNQYRLWFTDLSNVDAAQRGIIASYTYDAVSKGFAWAFSELEGIGVTSVDNSYHVTKERIVHGNQAGEIQVQETGATINGTRMFYMYQSPFSDFGDTSVRKALRKVFIMTRPEGDVRIGLEVRYDYESSDVHQPAMYPLEELTLPFTWGDLNTIWGDPLIRWGARDIPDREVHTEGSGFVVSFRIKSLNEIDDYPFDIQSLQIDLTAGGKI